MTAHETNSLEADTSLILRGKSSELEVAREYHVWMLLQLTSAWPFFRVTEGSPVNK